MGNLRLSVLLLGCLGIGAWGIATFFWRLEGLLKKLPRFLTSFCTGRAVDFSSFLIFWESIKDILWAKPLPSAYFLISVFLGDRCLNIIIKSNERDTYQSRFILVINHSEFKKIPAKTMSESLSAHTEHRSTFKVVVVGERAVGKTSLAIRYIKGYFSKMYAVTVGIEFYSKIITDHDT